MASDIEMLDVTRAPAFIPPPLQASSSPPPSSRASTGTSRRSSLAALLLPTGPDDSYGHAPEQGGAGESNAETTDDSRAANGNIVREDGIGHPTDMHNPVEDGIGVGLPADVHNPTAVSSAASDEPIPIPLILHPSPSPASPSKYLAANAVAASTSATQSSAPLPSSSTSPPPADPSAHVPAKPISTTKTRVPKPKARSRSPSPPPTQHPLPLQTIRLVVKLGGPGNYEVNFSRLAKETGQRHASPTPIAERKRDFSDSDEDDNHQRRKGKEREGVSEAEGGKPRKRKKNAASEYYDISDPFIDDSELAIDERTYFAQTKQKGFYVSSGEVALMKDKPPKKPKSKRLPLLAPLPSEMPKSSAGNRISPDILDDNRDGKPRPAGDGEIDAGKERESDGIGRGRDGSGGEDGDGRVELVGQKRKRYIVVLEGGKKRKVIDIQSFHPDLQVAVETLKVEIAKESWTQKGKFPPNLKPRLAELALLAIQLDEYDEHFFNLMPVLFPYNKFTMSKLIKRTVFHEHTALLMARQDALLEELAELVRQGFDKVKEEWERSAAAWVLAEKRQEKARLDALEAGANPPAPHPDSGAQSRHPTEETEVEQSHALGADGAGTTDLHDSKDSQGQHPPGKKYRQTERMKAIVWQLVLLSNECCRLENERNTLEGSMVQVSEQGLRKVLYQKIVAAFPEGWMSSGQISRDVSAMKKRFEKEALENGE